MSNKPKQKWLALGLLLAILIILGIAVLIPWYNALNDKFEQVDEQVYRIQRYQRVIAGRDNVLREVGKGRDELNALGYFYNQSTYSLAAADLQKRIKGIAERSGGDVSSTQVLPHKEEDELTLISVKVRMVGDMETLRSLLYEIQAEKPLMTIEDMSIIPQRGKRNKKTRKVEDTGKVTLSMKISGYMRKI
ncbi:MAG: type II secretion system protein M [Methylococcales bacterium]|nr:type II secretion system protein M [Methylococcales bacterium]